MNFTFGVDPLTVEIAIAKAIATLAHAGQRTRSEGMPYIEHCAAVAARVSDELKPAAWLHDVLEDSPITADQLAECGIRIETIRNVLQLTRGVHAEYGRHSAQESYDRYIEALCMSGNVDAMTVKLADLAHNLRPSCPDSLRVRYEKAQARLEARIRGAGKTLRGLLVPSKLTSS